MIRNATAAFAGSGVLFAAAIWGFAFVVVKDSLNAIGPFWMMAARFTIAAFALTVLFVRQLRTMTFTHLLRGALLGALLFFAYAFQTVGCIYTTAGKNAFLTAAYVVLVPLLGWALGGIKPHIRVFFAAVAALVGIALLSLGSNNMGTVSASNMPFTMNKGDVLTLICAVFYALHIIYMERSSKTGGMKDVLIHSTVQFAFAALFSWIIALFFDTAFPLTALHTRRVVMSMLYLGLLSTMIAFVLQNIALKYVPPVITSLLMSFESVFGVVFSALCLGERLTMRMAAGCAMIFCAVIMAQMCENGKVKA